MDIYSIEGNLKNLLLVDGMQVVNGGYELERRRRETIINGCLVLSDHYELFIPHSDYSVKKEMSIKPSRYSEDDSNWTYRKGWVDYNTTLTKAEDILAKRKLDELAK